MPAESRKSTTNHRAVIKRMTARLGTRTLSAQVGMKATTPRRQPRFKDAEGRTASKNLEILRAQKKQRRNPIHTKQGQDRVINNKWRGAINRFMRGNSGVLFAMAGIVAEDLVRIIQGNFDKSIHIRGSMKPLKKRYSEQKEYAWGKQPILVASGQLRDALISDKAKR